MPLLKKLYVNFETYLCVALIAVMIVCGSAVAWAEEVSRYCFICAVYLGTAVGAQRLAHVRITAQFIFLPVRARLAFRMIADVILFAFNIFLAWLCFDIVSESIRLGGMSATLGINVAYVEAVVPIGAVLMNWRILESYYLHWRDGTLAKLVAIETDLGLATQEGSPS